MSEEKANQRVEEFKRQLKTLTVKHKEAEARAEFAEKTVKKLQKEVDRLEGKGSNPGIPTTTPRGLRDQGVQRPHLGSNSCGLRRHSGRLTLAVIINEFMNWFLLTGFYYRITGLVWDYNLYDKGLLCLMLGLKQTVV